MIIRRYYYVVVESEATTLTHTLFGPLIFENKINVYKNWFYLKKEIRRLETKKTNLIYEDLFINIKTTGRKIETFHHWLLHDLVGKFFYLKLLKKSYIPQTT